MPVELRTHPCIRDERMPRESTVAIVLDRATVPMLTRELLVSRYLWGNPWKQRRFMNRYCFTFTFTTKQRAIPGKWHGCHFKNYRNFLAENMSKFCSWKISAVRKTMHGRHRTRTVSRKGGFFSKWNLNPHLCATFALQFLTEAKVCHCSVSKTAPRFRNSSELGLGFFKFGNEE